MPRLTIETVKELPSSPNGVQCGCALCDGHVIKTSPSAVVALPPRKYARIDPAGKKHNTLGEYAILVACGQYGHNIKPVVDKTYDQYKPVKCDVPILPPSILERYSGKRSGLRNMCKMRSINACRMPSLSNPLLNPRHCAMPEILKSCLTVDGRPIQKGDRVMFTRQPTESYESIVVLTIAEFIDCPCLCINTGVLDNILRGDDDGDDLNAFPLSTLAAKDSEVVAIPRQSDVRAYSTKLLTTSDFKSIYARGENSYITDGVTELIEQQVITRSQIEAFRSSRYNGCAHIAIRSNQCANIIPSMEPSSVSHKSSLGNIVNIATSDSLKGVVGENTRLLRNNLAPLQVVGRDVLWNGHTIGHLNTDRTGMNSKWVGLRLALRFGRMAQGELMSRRKLFAQGLQPSNILNMMLGIVQYTGCRDTLMFRVTGWRWIPECAITESVANYLNGLGVRRPGIKLHWIEIADGLHVACLTNSDIVHIPDGCTLCKITPGFEHTPKWGVLAALYMCFEMTRIEFQCLSIAVLADKFPVNVRTSNVSWTHLASAYPKTMVGSAIGENISVLSDTNYDLTAAKLLRAWS